LRDARCGWARQQLTHARTRTDFIASLELNPYDAIVADFFLADLDGPSAVTLAAQRAPDVPFILFSGAPGEELAVTLASR
jgi:CheY-like chemotaxis protein